MRAHRLAHQVRRVRARLRPELLRAPDVHVRRVQIVLLIHAELVHSPGIGEKAFWQKDVSKGFPPWLQRVEVPKKDGVVHHPVVTDTRSLLWVTNQHTITQHVWTSRVPRLEYADLCVFDLDRPPTTWQRCAAPRSVFATFSTSSGCARGSRPRLEGFSHHRPGRDGYGATFGAAYTARIAKTGDVWSGMRRRGRSLKRPMETLISRRG